MIGITLGDPNGVGPEIVLRAAAGGELGQDVVVIGDLPVLKYARDHLKIDIELHEVGRGAFSPGELGVLQVSSPGLFRAEQIEPGKLSKEAGAASLGYVEHATKAALAGAITAILTLPINKEAIGLSHAGFSGHTEYIATLCGAPKTTMMLASEKLIVTHVSTHVSLADAVTRVKLERVLDVIRLTHDAVSKLRPAARIAVAGLNPHAGEGGAFGREEIEIISPAINAARNEGMDVYGPEPADTVFYNILEKQKFDAVVCMYHDQGHIPMKSLDFDGGVNVTLGLPIIRTSVDHGTAFDIAYQGVARTRSMVHAYHMAHRLSGSENG